MRLLAGVYALRMVRALCVAYLAVLAFFATGASAAGPLVTAVHEPELRNLGADHALSFDRIASSGSTAIRIWLDWRGTAPNPPANPTNPGDPAYSWALLDRDVAAARARGLRVILTMYEAPAWAERGSGGRPRSNNPDPAHLAAFAQAAATRYLGQVFDWEVWNEPNLNYFLMPQYDEAGRSVAPALYRELVNAAAASIHGVDPRNNVVAGALAPFGPVEGHMPLDFMRKLLCMSRGKSPRPVCTAKTTFDVWSHHPYTQGGPAHHAYWPDDVSIGDLGEMRRLLRAAVRAGNVVHSRPVPFWVTEFSWETSPPDRQGVPSRRHARWTSEALYRMWANGVSLVTWWLLRDRPFPESYSQSGLFYCGRASLADEGSCAGAPLSGDARKGSFRAFRFPFVALPRGGKVFVWGRTPNGRRGRVVVEAKVGRRWRRVAVLRTDQGGIFSRTVAGSVAGRSVRARLAGRKEASLAFRAKRTVDFPLLHPFGCGGGLEC